MNKNILFLVALFVAGFVVFKVVKGSEITPAQATVEALPAMPTPPAETVAQTTEQAPVETKEEVMPLADASSQDAQPQMTQEEFEALIQELVKAAELEKKAKEAGKATQPAGETVPVEAPAAAAAA